MGSNCAGAAGLADLSWDDLLARLDCARNRYEAAIEEQSGSDAEQALQDLLKVCRYIDQRMRETRST